MAVPEDPVGGGAHDAPQTVPFAVKKQRKTEYAGMMELVDMQDLGDVTSVRVLGSDRYGRCKFER